MGVLSVILAILAVLCALLAMVLRAASLRRFWEL